MLVFGTQMHIVTFLFVCVEAAILFYLMIYKFARPNDMAATLNIVLIILLLIYNITGGLLPDPKLPGNYFVQESIAYGTGFITPCYFPYFVYRGFKLEKMRFHSYKGVVYFLAVPYVIFIIIFKITVNLDAAKNILILPVLYTVWVLFSLNHAIRHKYHNDFSTYKSREEVTILFFSLTPWIGLPIIAYFNLSQPIEAFTTNSGFLLLLALHIKQGVTQIKAEHQRLIESEQRLKSWNEKLQEEVHKRTRELERMSAYERMLKNCKEHQLTRRETEIVSLIAVGHSYRQIGESLFISERTVAKHVQNIFEKLAVNNKIELFRKIEW
ncbi:MAG TPA: LuxR C-terminal-related transcriptional regulator [Hanamia sp.]|nr:LuxR C-terminal-related transcriptional regulator [Hanamia sp.]